MEKKEKERNRERERERERDIQTDRQTGRQTDRQKKTERGRERDRDKQKRQIDEERHITSMKQIMRGGQRKWDGRAGDILRGASN